VAQFITRTRAGSADVYVSGRRGRRGADTAFRFSQEDRVSVFLLGRGNYGVRPFRRDT